MRSYCSSKSSFFSRNLEGTEFHHLLSPTKPRELGRPCGLLSSSFSSHFRTQQSKPTNQTKPTGVLAEEAECIWSWEEERSGGESGESLTEIANPIHFSIISPIR